jgi:hypothetical protein
MPLQLINRLSLVLRWKILVDEQRLANGWLMGLSQVLSTRKPSFADCANWVFRPVKPKTLWISIGKLSNAVSSLNPPVVWQEKTILEWTPRIVTQMRQLINPLLMMLHGRALHIGRLHCTE